jgi:hypothetical protein
MPDSIDTLIAFGLIMAVVSLLITILVQTGSVLLNLRGQNLSRGLTETLRTIAPVTFKTASANQGCQSSWHAGKRLVPGRSFSECLLHPSYVLGATVLRADPSARIFQPIVFDETLNDKLSRRPVVRTGEASHLGVCITIRSVILCKSVPPKRIKHKFDSRVHTLNCLLSLLLFLARV